MFPHLIHLCCNIISPGRFYLSTITKRAPFMALYSLPTVLNFYVFLILLFIHIVLVLFVFLHESLKLKKQGLYVFTIVFGESKPCLAHSECLLISHFSRVRLCATPSLGFSRQEHWSGLPFPSPVHKSEKWKWSHSVMSNSSLWVVPERWLWVSCFMHWTGTSHYFTYGNIHVSMLFSQIIPP